MTHAKHTTVMAVESDSRFMYISTVIGADPKAAPHMHKMPLLTLALRAAEYDLHPEDPVVLDLVMREHLYHMSALPSYEQDGIHPLFYLPTIEEARTFMEARIEDVRVDRKAPQDENRLLAKAVENKVATQAMTQVRDHFLKSYDKRVVEPIQFYRDRSRDLIATKRRAQQRQDPITALLQGYQRDKAALLGKR